MAYKNLVATIGKYEKDGKVNYVSRTVGTLIETDKGLRIKLDASFNPAGCIKGEDGGVWLAAFDPKPREQQATPSAARAQPKHTPSARDDSHFDDALANDFIDDDIPF